MNLRPVLLLWSVVVALPAQGSTEDEQAALRARRALQQNRIEVERLLDLRMRHDLGLPTDTLDQTFKHDAPVTSLAMDEMRRQLRDEDAQAMSLRQRFDKLRKQVEQLRADAQARVGQETQEQSFVQVPSTGATVGKKPPVSQANRSEPNMPAAPGVEPAPQAGSEGAGVFQLDPLRAQINGSADHQRVAQALFKAGQALMDRGDVARARGRPELAKDLDDRARERLLRAIDELKPLLAVKEPPYVTLFYLGRCREMLFRYSERHEDLSLGTSPRAFQQREQEVREPFLAISARDIKKTGSRNDVEVLGSWGQAAQTAMEHFRWMNLYSGYSAVAAIEALTWPGEKQ